MNPLRNPFHNDAEGVTAKFNLNLLARINRELGANFNLDAFEHHALYNSAHNRIEMHLASTRRQKVRLNGTAIDFRAGETIHTENSYKYTVDSFQALARGSGWSPLKTWTDGLFAVHALSTTTGRGIDYRLPAGSDHADLRSRSLALCSISITSRPPPISRPRTAMPGSGIRRIAGSTTSLPSR